ncbi:hypothetical protein H5410_011509 [Solanum commersonii]|uniref:Uncharacterized protein n=1 Tax=Solanum commersonii TaxID=4109 RepID=A0A9J6APV4_SOLCO|nr:hypothetical protein H5410_011509 [Solanum commersonii]
MFDKFMQLHYKLSVKYLNFTIRTTSHINPSMEESVKNRLRKFHTEQDPEAVPPPPPTAVVGGTGQLHGGGEEKRKKNNTAEKAAPVRSSTGRDTTTPFDDDDSRAIRVARFFCVSVFVDFVVQ